MILEVGLETKTLQLTPPSRWSRAAWKEKERKDGKDNLEKGEASADDSEEDVDTCELRKSVLHSSNKPVRP